MYQVRYPVIDMEATGQNIIRLRKERGLTVKDLQNFFGFDEPRAIYKWQRGETLPSVDNLYALSSVLQVPMNCILVPMHTQLNILTTEQQDSESCCSAFLCQAA